MTITEAFENAIVGSKPKKFTLCCYRTERSVLFESTNLKNKRVQVWVFDHDLLFAKRPMNLLLAVHRKLFK